MNIAIVQARMESKRLPGKALLKLDSCELIGHVFQRAKRIAGIGKLILATSIDPTNDVLADYAKSKDVEVFRGDEDNVLERFCVISRMNDACNIIRLTGDNPLIDSTVLSYILSEHCRSENDYSCITGMPVGSAGDIFSSKAIEESFNHANGMDLCDHIDLYVLENQDKFKISRYRLTDDLSSHRWTVDEIFDLQYVKALLQYMQEHIKDDVDAMDSQQIIKIIKKYGIYREKDKRVEVSDRNKYTAELMEQIRDVVLVDSHVIWKK